MTFEFVDEFNREVYAEWHRPLLDRLFGDVIELYHDLYQLTHSHRRDHNGGIDDGTCTAWPSPPYRAPVWRIIADTIGAKRFLEIGTAMGYSAALMADAGGPDSQVDTIEIDPAHADLAEVELGKRGLLDRVRILRGDSANILPELPGPYDVVFTDGGQSDMSSELSRLTRPGGASPEMKGRLREPLMRVLAGLRASLDTKEQREAVVLSRARDSYRRVVSTALEGSAKVNASEISALALASITPMGNLPRCPAEALAPGQLEATRWPVGARNTRPPARRARGWPATCPP